MAAADLTPSRIKEVLAYDPHTGVFTRKKCSGTAKTGDVAGWLEPHGYVKLSIDGKKYYAHRCAVFYMTGQWPPESVDHIDGDKQNNAFHNLRCVDHKTNLQNLRKAHCDNAVGKLGVWFNANAGKYTAECKGDDGVRRHLGLFNTPEEAESAYLQAKRTTQRGCTL